MLVGSKEQDETYTIFYTNITSSSRIVCRTWRIMVSEHKVGKKDVQRVSYLTRSKCINVNHKLSFCYKILRDLQEALGGR